MYQKKNHPAGRKLKLDPAIFRYSVRFNAIKHEEFLSLFEKSRMRTKAHFIVTHIFKDEFKVITIDKTPLITTLN